MGQLQAVSYTEHMLASRGMGRFARNDSSCHSILHVIAHMKITFCMVGCMYLLFIFTNPFHACSYHETELNMTKSAILWQSFIFSTYMNYLNSSTQRAQPEHSSHQAKVKSASLATIPPPALPPYSSHTTHHHDSRPPEPSRSVSAP